MVGDALEMDYLQIYTISDFISQVNDLIKKEIATAQQSPFQKDYNFGLFLNAKDQKKFVVSLYHAAMTKNKALQTDKLFNLSPETAAVKELIFLLKDQNLLTK
jgi:hypothetical protein